MADNTDLEWTERYDLAEQKHRHAMELSQQETRRQEIAAQQKVRNARIETIGLCFAGVLVTLTILAVMAWVYVENNNVDPPDKDQRREEVCLSEGGVWLPGDLLTSGDGLCVFPRGG